MDKITSEEVAIEIVRGIGLPVMIKASAGGGG
jgi:biotin carboxylase